MPYTPIPDRAKWYSAISAMPSMKGMKKGELTYIFYKIAKNYIAENGKSYTNISSMIGALDDAKEELRRRVLNPYEDKKIKENGDVE